MHPWPPYEEAHPWWESRSVVCLLVSRCSESLSECCLTTIVPRSTSDDARLQHIAARGGYQPAHRNAQPTVYGPSQGAFPPPSYVPPAGVQRVPSFIAGTTGYSPLARPNRPVTHAHPEPIPPLMRKPGSDASDRTPCRILGCECAAGLDDLSIGGMKRHVADFHEDAAKRGGVTCAWVMENGRGCDKKMKMTSWPKHLASVHLCSTQRKCGHCDKVICRGDALRRHIDNKHPGL